jgi:hypothetical protein
MKIQYLFVATISSIAIGVVAIDTAQAQKFVDVIGNPPYGSDPVNGVIGSGAKRNGGASSPMFENGIQSKVNAVGANLSAANITGSQLVAGNTIVVNPSAAEAAVAVINSPVNSNLSELDTFITTLGGGEPAQQLARSMQGMRSGDGSIDPTILTGAVNAYNTYLKSIVDNSQITQRPTSELDSLIQTLPPGQKAAQVILGKLVEATR